MTDPSSKAKSTLSTRTVGLPGPPGPSGPQGPSGPRGPRGEAGGTDPFVYTDIKESVTITATTNFHVLALGELPKTTTAAVGSVSSNGLVVAAHGGAFGSHSVTTVTGRTALRPKNLVTVFSTVTGSPFLSANDKQIWGLLQSENASNGHTVSGTTPTRLQISFVRLNATLTGFEAAPTTDFTGGKTLKFSYQVRDESPTIPDDAFINFVINAIPREVSFYTVATTSYDGDPNDGGAPAILDSAPIGSEYQQETPATTWKKGLAGAWTELGSGSVDLSAVDQDIVPAADGTYDIGTAALRWSEAHVDRLRLGDGGAPLTPVTGDLWIDGGDFLRGHGSQAFGNISDGGVLNATGPGSFVQGTAVNGGIQTTALASFARGRANATAGSANVTASGYASFASGYANSYGAGGSASLTATVKGAHALGVAAAGIGGFAQVNAGGVGGFAFGYAQAGQQTGVINADGQGATAIGFVYCSYAGGFNGYVQSRGRGSLALGAVYADTAHSYVEVPGASYHGAVAMGYAKNGIIRSTAKGAMAFGYASGTTILASAANAVQFGPGTNSQANSLKIGTAGLRLKGTAGAPTTPQIGDFWIETTAYGSAIRQNGSSFIGTLTGLGTEELDLRGTSFVAGRIDTDGANSTASVYAFNGIAMGRAYGRNRGYGKFSATTGGFAIGYAGANNTHSVAGLGIKKSQITAAGGGFAGGSCFTYSATDVNTEPQILATNGAFVWGNAYAYSTSGTSSDILSPRLIANSIGTVALGSAFMYGPGDAAILGGGGGSFAAGFAYVDSGGGYSIIQTSGFGSFAFGYANAYTILASGKGAMAVGFTTTGDITASGDNSVQFGPGTNDLDDSLKIGEFWRFKGTSGAPGAPVLGDAWSDGTDLLIRSGGKDRNVSRIDDVLYVTEATGTRTLDDDDHGAVVWCTNAGGCTVTVPVGLRSDFYCVIIQRAAGQVTIDDDGTSVLVKAATFATPIKTKEQEAELVVKHSPTANTYHVSGLLE